ncbi:MAG: BGTF surface domain-containing protein [Haloquadratum sp.]
MRSDGRRDGRLPDVSATAALVVLLAVVAQTALAPAVAAEPTIAVTHSGERVTVANGTSQVIRGTATAPVGTEVLVRVRSSGDTAPAFLKTATGVVTENGTWAAVFDFSGQAAGDTFTLNVRLENGSAETELEGAVVTCGGGCAETPPHNTPTPIPEQTQTPTRTGEETAPVSFGENIFLVERGGVAGVPIAFRRADTAVLVIGDEAESAYELEAVVRDGDGDGRAVVYVDTSLAGRGGKPLSASGGDGVTVRSETSLSGMLEPASYDVSLYAGGDRSDSPVDVGSLVVQSAATATPTETEAALSPTGGGESRDAESGFGSLALGVLASGVFLVGGAVVAVVLVRR